MTSEEKQFAQNTGSNGSQILEVAHLRKVYKPKNGQEVEALRDINFQVQSGEFIAIMGESGSGKTTLLNILAGLDRPTSGQILLEGLDMATLDNQALADFRRDKLGYVFQDFKLLDNFNLFDNMALPLVLSRQKVNFIDQRINYLARILGLPDLLQKYPFELSGGEKQRTAIGRALAIGPRLLLADEPTGQLDSLSSDLILDLMVKLQAGGQTVLMVTHSHRAASFASRVLFIQDGLVHASLLREGRDQEAQMVEIGRVMNGLSRKPHAAPRLQSAARAR
ncbi:MAG: ABC transporter ATP-binding protein [Eubacteriales bacterium]|nr:ABC transporter ATP-binding protein [Eubacteriales bacterium]